MSMNMSYARFRNTLEALRECDEALADMNEPVNELPDEEARAFIRLINLCKRLSDDYCDVQP